MSDEQKIKTKFLQILRQYYFNILLSSIPPFAILFSRKIPRARENAQVSFTALKERNPKEEKKGGSTSTSLKIIWGELQKLYEKK